MTLQYHYRRIPRYIVAYEWCLVGKLLSRLRRRRRKFCIYFLIQLLACFMIKLTLRQGRFSTAMCKLDDMLAHEIDVIPIKSDKTEQTGRHQCYQMTLSCLSKELVSISVASIVFCISVFNSTVVQFYNSWIICKVHPTYDLGLWHVASISTSCRMRIWYTAGKRLLDRSYTCVYQWEIHTAAQGKQTGECIIHYMIRSRLKYKWWTRNHLISSEPTRDLRRWCLIIDLLTSPLKLY